MDVAILSPSQPGLSELLAAGDAHMASLYPGMGYHRMEIEDLTASGSSLFGVLVRQRVVACGALVRRAQGDAEIKRLFVAAEFRGRGFAKKILRKIIEVANVENLTLRLETGTKQSEAVSLYLSHGFKQIDAFEPYIRDPFSVFMERRSTSDDD